MSPAPDGRAGAAGEVVRRFRAMNTDVEVVLVAGAGQDPADSRPVGAARAALAAVEREFARAEATLSRFRPDSDLSRLSAAGGRPFRTPPLLFSTVGAALDAARLTGGLFDPTLLGRLEALGYDRSFECLPADGPAGVPAGTPAGGPEAEPPAGEAAGPPAPGGWRGIVLDRRRRTVRLPPGCRLDLGGIAKGLTVDQAVRRLRPFGSFALDAGGDLYVAGSLPGGLPWTVGVESPLRPGQDLLVLALRDRAVATSSVVRRRWRQGGVERHHLLDPATGLPAESGLLAVTVVAGTVCAAEVLAKAVLLLGPQRGLRLLESLPGVAGLLVSLAGSGERLVASAGLAKFAVSPAALASDTASASERIQAVLGERP